jgi:hypothetical protein
MADEDDSGDSLRFSSPKAAPDASLLAAWHPTSLDALGQTADRKPIKLQALRRFIGSLDRARKEFDSDKLEGAICAIACVLVLLDDLDELDSHSHRPMFFSLSGGLADILHGREPPTYLRRRSKKASRATDSGEQWIMRAYAAVIMDRLVKGGMKKPEAAEAVSRRVADAGIKCGKRTVAEWRKAFMEGDVTSKDGSPPDFAIKHYREHTGEDSFLGIPRTDVERARFLDYLVVQMRHWGFGAAKGRRAT